MRTVINFLRHTLQYRRKRKTKNRKNCVNFKLEYCTLTHEGHLLRLRFPHTLPYVRQDGYSLHCSVCSQSLCASHSMTSNIFMSFFIVLTHVLRGNPRQRQCLGLEFSWVACLCPSTIRVQTMSYDVSAITGWQIFRVFKYSNSISKSSFKMSPLLKFLAASKG